MHLVSGSPAWLASYEAQGLDNLCSPLPALIRRCSTQGEYTIYNYKSIYNTSIEARNLRFCKIVVISSGSRAGVPV
jgi:hypothetical protein